MGVRKSEAKTAADEDQYLVALTKHLPETKSRLAGVYFTLDAPMTILNWDEEKTLRIAHRLLHFGFICIESDGMASISSSGMVRLHKALDREHLMDMKSMKDELDTTIRQEKEIALSLKRQLASLSAKQLRRWRTESDYFLLWIYRAAAGSTTYEINGYDYPMHRRKISEEDVKAMLKYFLATEENQYVRAEEVRSEHTSSITAKPIYVYKQLITLTKDGCKEAQRLEKELRPFSLSRVIRQLKEIKEFSTLLWWFVGIIIAAAALTLGWKPLASLFAKWI